MFAGLLVLLLYAVIVNPFGPALLEAPFKMAPLQSEYIDELAPIPWMKFFTVSFYDLLTASYALVNFLLLISLLSLLIALKGRKIRISHFLLAVGAIGLLTIHNRFRVEAVLLMLPLIKGHPLPASLKPDSYTLKKRVLAGLLLIVITLGYMQYFVKREGKWPLSDTEFPCGIVAFLNRAGEGGRVLNMPNVSGYLEWELYPRYQIFMDLQMVLFNDEDFFQLLNSFRSPDALKRLNKKYRFDFIMAAKDTSPFANVIAACPEYKLVFCDDWGALYAHEKLHPTLVKQYAITGLDPYQGRGEAAWAQASPEKLSLMKQELNKIHSIYDESAYSNLLLAGIALREGKGPQALQHTTTVIENFPETPYGYVMRGDVLLKQNDVDEAIVCYRAALRRIQESQRRSIYLKLANAYGALHNYKLQYKYLKRAISIWDVQTGYRELYYLANVAGEAKDLRNFEFLLKAAYFKCPENEKEAKAKIRWQLRMLEQETALDE